MNYCKNPVTVVPAEAGQAWKGYPAILSALEDAVGQKQRNGRCILAVETYPGVDDTELTQALSALHPARFLDIRRGLCPKEEFQRRISPFLTDDRVFGKMFFGEFSDFQVPEKLDAMREEISRSAGLVVVYGVGAAALMEPDVLLYADMVRWEIQ